MCAFVNSNNNNKMKSREKVSDSGGDVDGEGTKTISRELMKR